MGGPGLVPFVGIKGIFFHEAYLNYGRNAGYRRGSPPLNKLDTFTTTEFWAIPNEWYATLVAQELWDQKIRSYGLKALEMGPLKYGLRYVKDSVENVMKSDNGGVGLVTTIKSIEAILHGSLVLGDPESKQQAVTEENKRLMKGEQITDALSDGKLDGSGATVLDDDSGLVIMVALDDRVRLVPEYPEPYIGSTEFTQPCPRYEEIKESLINNRAEQNMAIDTMGTLPEGTFYKYIRDAGGISVTRRELNGFLSQCFVRKQLFIWDPFPSPGVVMRVAAGWPPTPIYRNQRQTIDNLFVPDPRKVELPRRILDGDLLVQEQLYIHGGEMRDMSFDHFRRLLAINNKRVGTSKVAGSEKSNLLRHADKFFDLIVTSAGAPDGSGMSTFTLGPDLLSDLLTRWNSGNPSI